MNLFGALAKDPVGWVPGQPWAFSLKEEREIPELLSALKEGGARLASLKLHERMHLLTEVRSLLSQRVSEVATLIQKEVLKPLPLAEQEGERALLLLKLTEEELATYPWEERHPLERTPRGENRYMVIRRVPLGPVLAITPFNFPLNLPLHKIAPALAAGAPVLLKPAPQAPGTARFLAELFTRAGFPQHSLIVVETTNELAERLVESEVFGVFSFTGSARVGWYLKRKAGAKKVLLELGGNAAVIVEPDADLKEAAERIARGGFAYSGQVCISVQRVFAQKRIYEEFRSRLVEATSTLPAPSLLSPLISEQEAERIRERLRSALARGAKLLVGGLGTGREIPPTILENVPHSEPLWREEIFGPVLTLEPYTELEEALTYLNDSEYGLQGALFTRNLRALEIAFQKAEVGALIINDATNFRADEMPFGGQKRSGIGREGPRWLFSEYTEPKTMIVTL